MDIVEGGRKVNGFLKCNSSVFINPKCHLVLNDIKNEDEAGMYKIWPVQECIGDDCKMENVLPIIGQEPRDSSGDVGPQIPLASDQSSQNSEWRSPEAFLVKLGDQLFGISTDEHNQARVHGVIKMVVPNSDGNVLMIENQEEQAKVLATEKGFDIDGFLRESNGNALFAMVALNGWLFVPINKHGELALILNKGYVILNNQKRIKWIRKNIDADLLGKPENQLTPEERIKETIFGKNEAITSLNGALIWLDNVVELDMKMKLIGSNNSLVNYQMFSFSIQSLRAHNVQHQLEDEDKTE